MSPTFALSEASHAWPAPAKINLFLHIVGKRADGYHELQTVFQFLDYADELYFETNVDSVIQRRYHADYGEEVDLCLRAAKLLQPLAAKNAGVAIDMVKRIPQGGGLGGGSSDAATVLIALNHLWKLGLTREKLAEFGLQLGADVPVFVMGRAAWAEGVGERLSPIDLAEPWYVVLNPQINVSTAQVFSNKHLTAAPQMKKIRALEEGVDASFGENQLEPLVCAAYTEVNELLEWLSQFGKPRMSGSGGSVFMPVNDQNEGEKILNQKPENSVGFVARGLNIHPLLSLDQ